MKYIYFFAILFLFSCSKQKEKDKIPTLNPLYTKAMTLRDEGKTDSAYLYFNKAKDGFISNKDSLSIGKCLLNMAIISTEKGDLFGGQELSLMASSFFNNSRSADRVYIISNLNNLGVSAYQLKNYSRAITFYQQSLKYTTSDAEFLILQNNIATAYRRSGDYKKALNIYQQILKYKISQGTLARTISDIAYTKWLQNQNYNPVVELKKGLSIREKIGSIQEQIASYVYLIDVYEKTKPNLALDYAKKMVQAASAINNPNDKLVALQKLIKLSPEGKGKYFESYSVLNDSIQTARNAAKNQFALIRYESEKNKADNLKLQKENTERAYQVKTRDLLIMLGGAVFLLSGTIAFQWYKRRRQKMEAEKQMAINESQLKTSKRIHDIVANGLYRVITELENKEDMDKDSILEKLDEMYEKSRDISYEITQPTIITENFHQRINEMLYSFSTSSREIIIAGNTEKFWEGISNQSRGELEHILGEFMINMKKHSEATSVSIIFQQEKNGACIIEYFDNGKGMAENVKHKNGLSNTGSRILNIGGAITFDQTIKKGLRIKISFPVH